MNRQMPAGTTLSDRYLIERELGAGGMATVYLAHDARHGRHVAIKVLHTDLGPGFAVDRFLREVQILAPLLHPHILGLIDSGESGGALYYVMPFVEGESLRAHLDRDGAVQVVDAVRILREVLDALSYAHGRGIVHRDIKPENILLTSGIAPGAFGWHALVADFGIAKAVEAARTPGGEGMTQFGTVLGTPSYMAPEQVAGDPSIDNRADIYSLGIVAYELLTGRPPFQAPTAQQIMAAHVVQAPPPLRQLQPSVSVTLEQFVSRCLSKEPADRFQSAAESIDVLEGISSQLSSGRTSFVVQRREVIERTFALDESVCRRLDRARLDPRIIGDAMSFLDNGAESDVLVCFIHGTGLDQRQAERYLRDLEYRAIAPTLFGFEPNRRRRIPVALADHLVLLHALLAHAANESRAERVIVVGLSSGADIALRLMAAPPNDPPLRIHGVLALGSNVSIETTFATRLFAQLGDSAPDALLKDLQRLGNALKSLDDWINVHGYLVDTIRK
jgi:serine/threonine protein kinase